MEFETASSSSSDPDRPRLCKICKKPAHGTHYGIETCRACAAFFRRAAPKKNKLKCRYPDTRCDDRNIDGYLQCKKCRLDLCFKKGMIMDSFQYQRDPLRVTERPESSMTRKNEIPRSLENFVGRPHMLIRCEPDLASTEKVYIDLNFLVQKVSQLFLKKPESKQKFSNPVTTKPDQSCLKMLTKEMNRLRKEPIGEMEIYGKIGKKEQLCMLEYELLRSAKWFSKFEAFRKMDLNDKIQFVSKTWCVWGAIEKLALTAQKRDTRECDELDYMLNDDAKCDMKNTQLDFSWCTNYGLHQLEYFLGRQDIWIGEEIVRILRKLQPTDVEQNFIIAQTCLTYAAKHRSSVNLKAIEQMQETISNDIHVYYTEHWKLSNYAGRLSQILKCDRLFQSFMIEKRKKADLARLFDVYFIRVSHPEMFEETGF